MKNYWIDYSTIKNGHFSDERLINVLNFEGKELQFLVRTDDIDEKKSLVRVEVRFKKEETLVRIPRIDDATVIRVPREKVKVA